MVDKLIKWMEDANNIFLYYHDNSTFKSCQNIVKEDNDTAGRTAWNVSKCGVFSGPSFPYFSSGTIGKDVDRFIRTDNNFGEDFLWWTFFTREQK